MKISSSLSRKLLQIKAIKLSPQNPFTWASGILSPIYCDNRITLAYPEIRNMIKEGFAEQCLSYESVDLVAGVATAGIAHGALLADHMDLPFAYVRSKAKGHGRQNTIEGEVKAGQDCIVIEDLISTGGSSIKAVEDLREAGVNVIAVLAIFSYNLDKAKKNFEKINCPFATLTDYANLITIAAEDNFVQPQELDLLKIWSQDPENWTHN